MREKTLPDSLPGETNPSNYAKPRIVRIENDSFNLS